MYIVCLDMEGVLTPEIWIEFAKAVNIPELTKTTRDEPDYDKLMKFRIETLKNHNLGIAEIQKVISGMDTLPGAKEFIDELRTFAEVIILSDTFYQFAMPLMSKLDYPTLFCNDLVISDDGIITDYKMRTEGNTKLTAVDSFHSIGFETIASGDSFNDIAMIRASKAGFLFRSTDEIKASNPDIPALETYDELLDAIKGAMK